MDQSLPGDCHWEEGDDRGRGLLPSVNANGSFEMMEAEEGREEREEEEEESFQSDHRGQGVHERQPLLP